MAWEAKYSEGKLFQRKWLLFCITRPTKVFLHSMLAFPEGPQELLSVTSVFEAPMVPGKDLSSRTWGSWGNSRGFTADNGAVEAEAFCAFSAGWEGANVPSGRMSHLDCCILGWGPVTTDGVDNFSDVRRIGVNREFGAEVAPCCQLGGVKGSQCFLSIFLKECPVLWVLGAPGLVPGIVSCIKLLL